ncbi:hypothetical protein G9A89_016721 [Geosiphon pyriformis]|nr:hypothetical protein G9A89_016721 [Geosiphon pyriformis]
MLMNRLLPLKVLRQNVLSQALSKNGPVITLLVRKKTISSTMGIIPDEHQKLLNAQRGARPLSPWNIYKPQLTSILSLGHRVTGAGLATILYASALAYTTGPLFGFSWDTDTVVAAITTLPPGAKFAGKFTLGFAASYHTFNGIRHLIWDTGLSLTIKGVYTTGWTVLTLSTISSLYLALL